MYLYVIERKTKERTGMSYKINIHVHVVAIPMNIVIRHVASYLKVCGGGGGWVGLPDTQYLDNQEKNKKENTNFTNPHKSLIYPCVCVLITHQYTSKEGSFLLRCSICFRIKRNKCLFHCLNHFELCI